MSAEPTKIPENSEIDALERQLVVENLEVVERVVWGILRIERRLASLRAWYEETRDKRKKKAAYLKRLVEAYAVPWRQNTGESVLPIESGTVRITKGRVVDLSNEEEVTAWVLEQHEAEEKTLASGQTLADRVPVRVTVEPDWKTLREWARWSKAGEGMDPRTSELIPGLKRGIAAPWHVSIKERDVVNTATADRLEAQPELDPIPCDVCGGEGRVRFIRGTVGSPDAYEEVVECGHCGGSGILGLREEGEDERRSA